MGENGRDETPLPMIQEPTYNSANFIHFHFSSPEVPYSPVGDLAISMFGAERSVDLYVLILHLAEEFLCLFRGSAKVGNMQYHRL